MLINLPQDFLDAMNSSSRSPVQLMEFITPEGTFYLSDTIVGTVDGLDHNYQPWVESWGKLVGNTRLQNIYDGNSLEIKSGTITLVIGEEAKTFAKQVFQYGIENTIIKLYQWFKGMTSPPVLIDTMICQDPINHSEASMLLKFDVVSVLMQSNPPLWDTAVGFDSEPVVIGKAKGIPLKDLQTARKTEIADDITFDFTGQLFIGNGIGFPASGVVSIDSEDLSYDWISASAVNITARGVNGTTARPHLRGALMVPYGAVYDYSVCSGPVDELTNLLGNGEAYENPVTFLTNQNPVIARFNARPPWLKVSSGSSGNVIVPDEVTDIEQLGGDTESNYGDGASAPSSPGNINSASGGATLSISNKVEGGAGSITKSATSITQSNPASNDYTEPYSSAGPAGSGSLTTKCGIFGNCGDDTTNYVDIAFTEDLSHLDNLTKLTITIPFGLSSKIVASDVTCKVYFINSSGSSTLISPTTWTVENYDLAGITGTTPPWYNYTLTYEPAGLNFSTLIGCKIRVELTNTQAKTSSEVGTTSQRANVIWNAPTWKIDYFVDAGTVPSPYQELCSKFNHDYSSKGTIVNVDARLYFSAYLSNATVTIKIVRRSTNNMGDDVTLQTLNISSSLSGSWYNFYDLPVASWGDLENLRIGVYQVVTGPDTEGVTRVSNISFDRVEYDITYQPDDIPTPDEERVVYAETITVDVTSSMGADPTPAKVVQYLIENHSNVGGYIDTDDFNAAHTNYTNANYFLNGVLEADTYLHDAIKKVLAEGLCRLAFNQGKIKLLTYFEEESQVVDFVVSEDIRQIRSGVTDNQPTSLIKNDVTIRYNLDYSESVFDGKIEVENAESITKFFRQEYVRELELVDSETVAQHHADRLLEILATPASIYSFNVFMPGFLLEKGDRVSVRQFIDKRFSSVGNILTVNRTFGQGKNEKINTFQISIANPETFANLDLEESIIVADDNFNLLKEIFLPKEEIVVDDSKLEISRNVILREEIVIEDNIYLDLCVLDGYGTCGYGLKSYGD